MATESNDAGRPTTGAAQTVGLVGIIALGLYLAGGAWFTTYSLLTFWPTDQTGRTTISSSSQSAGTQSSAPLSPGTEAALSADAKSTPTITSTSYFTFQIEHTVQQGTILIVLFAGALGSLIHGLRSFFWYVGNRDLRLSWIPMYLLLPFTGALLALVFYLVLIAGLFAGAPGPDAKVAGFAAIAALVGMFSTPAAEKLQEIFETIFTKRPQGKDTVRPVSAGPAPAVTKVTATAAAGGLQRLLVEGTDFSEPLTVTLNDTSGATRGLDARNVTMTQFEADAALSPGTWTILVTTKDGKTSAPLQFTV